MGKIEDKIRAIERIGNSLHTMTRAIVGNNVAFLTWAVGEQMYEKGQDGYGKSLGRYSPYTVKKKKSKGQRYDHITLRDTGVFHKELQVVLDDDGFYLYSRDGKSEKWIIPRWGESIFRPDEETLELLIDEIKEQLTQKIKQKL